MSHLASGKSSSLYTLHPHPLKGHCPKLLHFLIITSDRDWSALRSIIRAIWTSWTIWSVIVSLIAGHCLANYLGKTATSHVPTHVACQYQPVICVIAIKTSFVVHDRLYINSRHPWLFSQTARQSNCALYQFDQSSTDQKLMMRDLEKNGDLYN